MKKIISGVLMASLGGIFSLGIYKLTEGDNVTAQHTQPVAAERNVQFVNLPPATESTTSFVTAAEKSLNSVVHVKTVTERYGYTQDPLSFFFNQSPQRQKMQPRMGSGSGVIISDDGYIVTNNHVIDGADKIQVTLNDERTYDANLIGRDPSIDIALLKVEEAGLPYINYGNSDNIKVGEWVLAVGNPFNLTSTVTAGIVSAKGRNINLLDYDPAKGIYPVESFIQTDAAVNPGNSGGALVDTYGNLVGINTAIASRTGSYAGYSFAVPVNIVKKAVRDLLEYGEVQRAFIGVSIQDVTQQLAEEKGMDDLKGVYVAGLTENGAANEAGITEGDVITEIEGVAVNSVPELQEQVSKYRPGDDVRVSVRRGNNMKDFTVKLRNKNGTVKMVKHEAKPTVKALGAEFAELSADEKESLGISNGIKVTGMMGGKLRSAGVREGFIITRIDKNEVNDVDDVKEAIEGKSGGVLIEGIYPDGTRAYYGIGA